MTTANLALQDNDSVVQYTSVGESDFTSTFPVLVASELKVSIDQVEQTYGVDYTITSGLGEEGGVEIHFASATTAGEVITLWLDMPIERLTGFTAGAATLLPEDLNADAVQQLRITQMLRREVRSAIRLRPDDPVSGQDMLLPAVTSRVGKYLAFDAAGAPVPSAGTGNDSALRTDLANGLSGPGNTLVANVRTAAEIAALVVPSNYAYNPRYVTRQGAVGDGVTDDTQAFLNAFAAANEKEIIIPGGYTFLVDGNIPVLTQCRIRGEGTIKKKAGNIRPIFLLADEGTDIMFEGVRFDGNMAAFSTGNAVPVVLGHLNQWIRFSHCIFENVIDAGVKLRNSAYTEIVGGRFYNIGENAVELKNYDVDPRTMLAYTGSLPASQGGHKILGAWFGKITGNADGSGDGNGVLINSALLAAGTAYPMKGTLIQGCQFANVFRGVWIENNDAGCESLDIQVLGNAFRGDATSYGGRVYQGVGFIGAKRFKCNDNSLTNIGNFAPSSDTCNGVIVGGTSDDGEIARNTIVDDTLAADRMDYAIKLSAGSNLRVHHNRVAGGSLGQINVNAAVTSHKIFSNDGASEATYSWGNLVAMTFKIQNIPGTATTALTPEGFEDDTEAIMAMPARLVGMAVKLTSAVSTGTITFKPYTNGVSRSNLDAATADFGVGTQGIKTIAVASGVTVAAGDRVRVDVVTAGFTPTTADALVTLFFDTEYKE